MMQEELVNEEALASFDVTLLFTNIPIEEAVNVIHRKLAAEDDLVVRTPLPAEDSRAPSALPEAHLLQLQ